MDPNLLLSWQSSTVLCPFAPLICGLIMGLLLHWCLVTVFHQFVVGRINLVLPRTFCSCVVLLLAGILSDLGGDSSECLPNSEFWLPLATLFPLLLLVGIKLLLWILWKDAVLCGLQPLNAPLTNLVHNQPDILLLHIATMLQMPDGAGCYSLDAYSHEIQFQGTYFD